MSVEALGSLDGAAVARPASCAGGATVGGAAIDPDELLVSVFARRDLRGEEAGDDELDAEDAFAPETVTIGEILSMVFAEIPAFDRSEVLE